MSSGGSDRTSSFDRMLEESRQRFDELSRGSNRVAPPSRSQAAPPAPAIEAASSEPAPPTPIAPPPRPAAAPDWTPAVPFDAGATESGRMLNGRFGDAWSFETPDIRRDGADLVVWGRLVVGDVNHDKTRRGRATIGRTTADPTLSGSADGIAFAVSGDGGPADDRTGAEAAAFETAAAAALAACVKGL